MAKRSQPGKEKQIASAFILSYPQLFVWALVFAFIGGLTVWSSNALTNSSGSGSMTLRMIADNNHNGLPNWGDTVAFDVASSVASSTLQLGCYQNGSNVMSVQNQYDNISPSSSNRYLTLSSASWAGGPADCRATLFNVEHGKTHDLASYNFHVSP